MERERIPIRAGDANTTHEEPPEDIKFAAVEDAFTRERELLAAQQELSTTLLNLGSEANREKQSAFGAENWKKYNAFREKQRARQAELQDSFTLSTQGIQREEEFKSQQVADSRSLIKQLGVNVSKIESIHERYRAKTRGALTKMHRIDEDIPFISANPADLPERKDNPWMWRPPPYNWQAGGQYSYSTRGYAFVSHAENRLTGEIGCTHQCGMCDVSDSDTAQTSAYSEIQFWYKMPAPGMIELWVWLQSIDTWLDGRLIDEFGFSYADITQQSQLYLVTGSETPGSGRLMYVVNYHRGGAEGSWVQSITPPGGQYIGHLFSMSAYPSGQWVFIKLGIWDMIYCWVDDMEVNAQMWNRWLVQQIALRSTGAP